MPPDDLPWLDFDDYPPGIYPTLRNLHASMALGARCGKCRHIVQLNVAEIVQRLTTDIYVVNLRRRLRCDQCGNCTDNRLLYRTVE